MQRVGYQSLNSPPNDIFTDENPPDAHENDVMFHMVPDTNKNTRWNHVEDLDSFFARIYYYHQKHGFWCMFIQDVCDLLMFVFIVGFGTLLLRCVDYPVLFRTNTNITDIHAKVTISDAIIPPGTCIARFNFVVWYMLVIALVFWVIRLVRVVRNTYLNMEIRAFYRSALNIPDNELENLTWYDVQKRLRDVQREQQMCIHKQELTELDIYHRILRFKNYTIAMMNKQLLPVRFNVPIAGDIIFLTHGLKYNFELILFWGPWAPFENNWHLKEDFKKVSKRKELAQALASRITWIGLFNLVLFPVILLWQILYAFFTVVENLKREPGAAGIRQWSRYGRIYLRHFNELEHELHGRLVRAYKPAARYVQIFNSPTLTIVAKNVGFMSGSIIAVITALTIWDEDVITVQHVLLTLTTMLVVTQGCRAFIPDENMVFCPETLLRAVLAHAHYLPDHWKGQAHTTKTREQFSLLFQYRLVSIVEELVSPLVTPIILLFYLRPRALEIVDFYRNFTVEVVGVGDVCSFAQMDVRKHGNPTWQTTRDNDMDGSDSDHPSLNNNAYTQAENGKTELSLVHFTHTNPEWKPPQDSGNYIANLKERAVRDANLPTVLEENPLFSSLNTISSMGGNCSNIVNNFMMDRSLLHLSVPPGVVPTGINGYSHSGVSPTPMDHQQTGANGQNVNLSYRGNLSRQEGPLYGPPRGIVSGIQQSGFMQTGSVFPQSNNISFANSFAHYPLQFQNQSAQPSQVFRTPPISELGSVNVNLEGNSLNMCVDALYIHELHHQELRRRHNRNSSIGNIHNPSNSSYQNQGTSQHLLPQLHQNQHPHFQVHAQLPLSNPPVVTTLQQSQHMATTNSSSETTPLLPGSQLGGTFS